MYVYNVLIMTAKATQLSFYCFSGQLCTPHSCSVCLPLTRYLTYPLGVLPPPGRGLQLREQCADCFAGDRGGHSNCDCDQSGAFEEEAIRHHQPWHRGGKLPVVWSRGYKTAHTSALDELLSILFI